MSKKLLLSINENSNPIIQRYSLFSSEDVPNSLSGGSGELGMKFYSDVIGRIIALKFYKPATATGNHIGKLWDPTGNLLSTANFNESFSGWQEVFLPTPILVESNLIYTVSYNCIGHFNYNINYFDTAKHNSPLHAPISAGCYNSIGYYPNYVYSNSNYWVDVLFEEGE